MGIRVTTRTRPRRDFPFTFGTTTAAAAATEKLAGPFTMAQLVELIFRVRKVRIVGEISHDRYIEPPPEEEPFTEASTTEVDIVLPRRNTSEIDTAEIADEVEMLIQSTVGLQFFDMPTSASFGGFLSSIQKDETGGYWLDLNVAGSDETGVASFTSGFGGEEDFIIDAMLTIGGAAVAIPTRVIGFNVTAATCAVTIEEWWPYATSAGAAAWNTTTGAPVNGGPGA